VRGQNCKRYTGVLKSSFSTLICLSWRGGRGMRELEKLGGRVSGGSRTEDDKVVVRVSLSSSVGSVSDCSSV
jgi:hypothetical protein